MLNMEVVEKERNEEIFKRSDQTLIITEINKQRLNSLAHMLRVPERTRVKIPLRESTKQKRKVADED